MKTSEQIDQIATALAKAQGAMGPVVKELTAKVTMREDKGQYSYDYADLAAVFDAVREACSSNGIAILQSPIVSYQVAGEGDDTFTIAVVTVTTRLLHASGQWLENSLELRTDDLRPQGVGSAITYGRRYSAQSILGVAAERDDDGNQASGYRAATGPRHQESSGSPHRPEAERPADAATVFWTWARAEIKAGHFTEVVVRQSLAANHNDFNKTRGDLESLTA